jgi:hypothetical protein
MADPTTTYMGLTIPQYNSTPDGPNATSGTYPNEVQTDLTLIDAHDHTTGKGVKIPTAGININANLSFNGYSLTSVAGITATGTITTSGTLSGPLILFDTANSYTSAGTMTIAPNVATGGTALILNNSVSMSSGSIFVVQNAGSTVLQIDYAGDIIMSGAVYQATASTGQLIQGNAQTGGTGVTLNSGTHTLSSGYLLALENNGVVSLAVDYAGGLQVYSSITMVKAATQLTLNGYSNATPVSGGAVVINGGGTTLTSGLILSVRNNGAIRVGVDFAGNLTLAGPVGISQLTVGDTLFLNGHTTAGGSGNPAVVVTNQVTQTAGSILSVQDTSFNHLFDIAWNGHIIPSAGGGSGLTPGSADAKFGTISLPTYTGSDVSGTIGFKSGSGATGTIAAGNPLFYVSLFETYSSENFGIQISPGPGAPASEMVAGQFYGVPSANNIFAVYCTAALTPAASTVYNWQFMTMSTGAA